MPDVLANVLDGVERADGPRGLLRIDVPGDWLAPGSEIEVVVPLRLACARCEGGGCDACGRSGVIRIALDVDRTFRFTLSQAAGDLRLARPLGPEAGLEELIVALREADAPSEGCRRVEAAERIELVAASDGGASRIGLALAVAVALAAAVLGAVSLAR